MLVMRGRMTHTGTTSMEVRVDSYVESVLTGGLKLVNTAFVVQVALDDQNRPTPVPPLLCETPEETADFQAGARRKEMRMKQLALYE